MQSFFAWLYEGVIYLPLIVIIFLTAKLLYIYFLKRKIKKREIKRRIKKFLEKQERIDL
ncbi:MAG: hypothetical protein JXB60_05955 [Candidatus Cloacimonetes bacterium]|nr:hypothetical protein [Candidatus Cloacimonadota bacterium]